MKEIKKLSANCKFGTGLSEQLKDRLVSDVHSKESKRLFRTIKDENLTFDKALEIAIQSENVEREIPEHN